MNAPNNNIIQNPTEQNQTTVGGNGQQTEMSDYLQNNVFTATNFMYFIWFLGIYLIVYFLMSPDKGMMGRIINIIIIVWLLFLFSYIYFSMSADDKTHFMKTMEEWTKVYFEDDKNFLWEIGMIAAFYILVFVLNIPMTREEKPFMVKLIEDKLWIIFFTFVVIFFFKYFSRLLDLFFYGAFLAAIVGIIFLNKKAKTTAQTYTNLNFFQKYSLFYVQ